MEIRIQALDSVTHREHGWCKPGNFLFAAQDHWVPVSARDINALLPHYLLAFAHMGEGKYRIGVVQGLRPGENLYLDRDGRWRAPVLPELYRAYPFLLSDVGGDVSLLCIRQDSGLYRDMPGAGEQRFFDEEGGLQPELRQILTQLQAIRSARELTQRAVDAVVEANILEPLVLPGQDAGSPEIKGLYRINDRALNALSGEPFEKLRSARALPLIYAQLFSLAQGRLLVAFDGVRQREPLAPLPRSLDALFEAGGGETLSFGGLGKL